MKISCIILLHFFISINGYVKFNGFSESFIRNLRNIKKQMDNDKLQNIENANDSLKENAVLYRNLLNIQSQMNNEKIPNFVNDNQFVSLNTILYNSKDNNKKYYPYSRSYYENYIKRLNNKNQTIQDNAILNLNDLTNILSSIDGENITSNIENNSDNDINNSNENNDNDNKKPEVRIIINRGYLSNLGVNGLSNIVNGITGNFNDNNDNDNDNDNDNSYSSFQKKSKNFEIITKHPIKFCDIGGYENVKRELLQCVDLLINYKKYSKYNVRTPKGLIMEGPPGNGKTLLAKGFAGEAKIGFIPVSGSEFQEKYVGVGSSRVRELFSLAKKNAPCIIFIDEIDAIGRKRSGDDESSSSERDNTLNELLVALDGFKNSSGVFVVGATNRIDLLDKALLRPGRIDKKIYIGNPDATTREAIIKIHLRGKPYDNESVNVSDLVDSTIGLSGAQIENLLNEAMLNALRDNKEYFDSHDLEVVMNKMIVGWQPTDHQYTSEMIDQITIHEMGHAIVGLLVKHHSKMNKVVINLSSPTSPGYTIFEGTTTTIYTREGLFEHLMILLGGRIAEEIFYNASVSSGAISDFEEALKLAEKMVIYYGMGNNIIYPSMSEKYKEIIDTEVFNLINEAYDYSNYILKNSKNLIIECASLLKRDKVLKAETILEIINRKHPYILEL
jgi:cell division protease FtsH